MITDIPVFLIGLLFIYLGAEGLVSGSAKLALSFGIRPAVMAATVIAFGTSSPEGLVSWLAAIRGSQGIALGNIIGSNIANIGLVLGLSALVRPIKVEPGVIKKEVLIMLGASVLLYLLSLDKSLGRIDGFLLLMGLAGFILYQIITARYGIEDGKPGGPKKVWRNTVLIVVGLIILLLGAYLLVESGVNIARKLGISEFVIGLTMIALGTSLPELATSLVATIRKKGEISAANVVGSNILNILCMLGVAAMIMPLDVTREVLIIEFPIMIAFSLLVMPLLRRGSFTRVSGAVFFIAYIAFIGRLL